ncbi:MAG: hypothetical protein WCD37_12805 [Chloroflexia bacterium]
MSKKLITVTKEIPEYAKAPEYGVATRSTTLALTAIVPYGIGVWLFSLFGDVALYLTVLVVVVCLVASTYYAVLALARARRNERPRLVKGWAIIALAINVIHIVLVVIGISMLMNEVARN